MIYERDQHFQQTEERMRESIVRWSAEKEIESDEDGMELDYNSLLLILSI